MPEPGPTEPFVGYLERMRDNRWRHQHTLTALERAQGLRLADAPEVWSCIYPWCSIEPHRWRDQCLLTVASLFAGHQLSWQHQEDEGPTNLGRSLARLRAHERATWVDQQVEVLLGADRITFGNQLVPMFQLLAKHRVPVDWSEFLRDVYLWWPAGSVAQRWARAYYQHQTIAPEEKEEADVR